MFRRFVNQAKVPFFQPMDIIYKLETERWEKFQEHYGADVSKQTIINNVYGGYPLTNLFSYFQLETNEDTLRELRAKLTLIPTHSNLKPLIINNLSLKQFLVAGLPSRDLLPWDGKDNWDKLDPQYRLELCHAEVCRWSILIKKEGVILSDVLLENHEEFSDIELVNNCTTTDGFEFKLVYKGSQYHGSFGSKGTEKKELLYLYRRFAQWQAGSLGYQRKDLTDDRPKRNFFSYYFNPIPLDQDNKLDQTYEFNISLERYRSSILEEVFYRVEINYDDIDYERWGTSSEYFQKPQKRRLVKEIVNENGTSSIVPPTKYSEIQTARKISFPNFQNTGIYDLSDPQEKIYFRWLYEFDTCILRRLSDGRVELELRRSGTEGEYQLRRFVFGNILLEEIPVYPDFWTLHRFGYGARNTVMDYDDKFVPPSDTSIASHYAYQLGGEGSADEAFNYICPEGFGVERAIFAWEDSSREQLVIDLISFERILPLWQGKVDFSEPL